MKIRKLYMALVGILMSTQLANAQQNMFVVGNNGKINAIWVSSVDYATFNIDADKLFTISNYKESTTTNSITVTCTVVLSSESNVKELSVTPEVGVCYSKDNAFPTIEDDCLLLGWDLGSYRFTLESLISGTTYYFRPYVKLANAVFYVNVVSAKTRPDYKIINGHKFIDLNLPSGLLWAETNIGAATAADDGNYYAWGVTKPTKYYNWGSYKYGASYSNLYKYKSSDSKTVLDKNDDAAYVNWGDSCRMPTKAEFAELRSRATWTWTSMSTSSGSSVNGYKVTGSNGNSIFLPASGFRDDGGLYKNGSYGHYWSSSLGTKYGYAYSLTFDSSECNQYDLSRYKGFSVRPVAEP